MPKGSTSIVPQCPTPSDIILTLSSRTWSVERVLSENRAGSSQKEEEVFSTTLEIGTSLIYPWVCIVLPILRSKTLNC